MNKNNLRETSAITAVQIGLAPVQTELYVKFQGAVEAVTVMGFDSEKAEELVNRAVSNNAEKIRKSYGESNLDIRIKDNARKAKEKARN